MNNLYAVFYNVGGNAYVRGTFMYSPKENHWESEMYPNQHWPSLIDALASTGVIVPLGGEIQTDQLPIAEAGKRKYTKRTLRQSGSRTSIEGPLEPAILE